MEGLSFKGKLIGVLEVSEARGDRMCQEALAELKMAVRAAGEHKQRIIINVAMDGIRLRDERSSVSMRWCWCYGGCAWGDCCALLIVCGVALGNIGMG